LGSGQQMQPFGQEWPADSGDDDPHMFWKHYWDSASCSDPDRSGDLRRVTMVSDFYSARRMAQHRHVHRLPAGGIERSTAAPRLHQAYLDM
jgi:hypothetical protein